MTPPTKLTGSKTTKHPGVRKLEDGRYLVLRTWVDPNTGRKIFRQKVVAGDLDAAVAARAGLRPQEPNGKSAPRPRFEGFANEWLERHSKRLGPSTAARYKLDVSNLVAEFGDWWVDAIDYDAIDRWQSQVHAEGYAAPTINGYHRTLRLILDVAVRKGLMRTNPARDMTTLKEGRTKGARGTSLSAIQLRTFTEAIVVAMAKSEDPLDAQLGRLLHVLAWTGMRLGEVLALRFEDVSDGELRVERTVWRGHAKADKTDDPRRITIVEPLLPLLDEQRRYLMTSQHPGLSSGLMFPGTPRQAMAGQVRRKAEAPSWFRSQSPIQEAVRAVCDAAKVPRITPHALRRTFEDLLREAGVEQMVRRAVAGWRSDRAQAIYATVKREDRDAAAKAVVRLVTG